MSAEGTCPDCNGPNRAGWVDHGSSCPLIRALDQTTADDRDWFARHPGRQQRSRKTTVAERSELRLVGRTADRHVVVSRLAAGSYTRRFSPSGVTDLLMVAPE